MALGMGETKHRILERLRSKASCAHDLASNLGISKVAVHRHLEALEREGLVRSHTEKHEGRGRPKQVFVAVDEQAQYARMCDDILTHLRDLFGSEGVLGVLSRRNAKLLGELAPQLEGLPLEEKLARLSEFLSQQGYHAHHYQEGEFWYLEQKSCPKLALSSQHGELCLAELEMYQKLLGVPIVREERIAAGGKCCRYRIEGETPNP